MKKILVILIFLTLGFIEIGNAQEPGRITIDEVKDLIDLKKDFVIVDVRGLTSYKNGHIPKAISLPSNELADRAKELPKDKLLVLY